MWVRCDGRGSSAGELRRLVCGARLALGCWTAIPAGSCSPSTQLNPSSSAHPPIRSPVLPPCSKGFVKVALKSGANLVPVLGFGENDLFQRVQVSKGSLLWRLQTLSKQVGGRRGAARWWGPGSRGGWGGGGHDTALCCTQGCLTSSFLPAADRGVHAAAGVWAGAVWAALGHPARAGAAERGGGHAHRGAALHR